MVQLVTVLQQLEVVGQAVSPSPATRVGGERLVLATAAAAAAAGVGYCEGPPHAGAPEAAPTMVAAMLHLLEVMALARHSLQEGEGGDAPPCLLMRQEELSSPRTSFRPPGGQSLRASMLQGGG